MKYQCTVIFDASTSVEVEADSPEEAAAIAEDETSGYQTLCHQCSNTLETGDAVGVHVYNEESTEHLLDTTLKPAREWVGLTDEEIDEAQEAAEESFHAMNKGLKPRPLSERASYFDWHLFRALEAKLREKNA